MPKPRKNEKKPDYIQRCVRYLVRNEGKDPDQAVAICNALWDEHKE